MRKLLTPDETRTSGQTARVDCPPGGEVTVVRCGGVRLWSAPPGFIFQPREGLLSHIVTVNAEIFVYAHEDPNLWAILEDTTNTIDGRVLQWLCKGLYPGEKIARLTGANFIYDLASHCCSTSQCLFLLGSDRDTNAAGVERLRHRFPGLAVAGYSPPFVAHHFPESLNQRILDEIASFRPHHLVVCFGPKKQEYWIHENFEPLVARGVRCAYGLGATIDFVAGKRRWAPMWVQQIGMAWLFRLLCEPRRYRRTLAMFRMPYYAARTKRQVEKFGFSPESDQSLKYW